MFEMTGMQKQTGGGSVLDMWERTPAHLRLKLIDGWIFAIHIVADYGRCHALSHALRRTRDRIAPEIYHSLR